MRSRAQRFTTLAQITTVALALGSLSACGSDSSGESADGKVTLTVATFNEFGYEDLITEYMDLNPDIVVKQKKAATTGEARDNMNRGWRPGPASPTSKRSKSTGCPS